MAVLAGTPGLAASGQSSFSVGARVESSCTVASVAASVEVRCARGTSYNLALNVGHASAARGDVRVLSVPARDAAGVLTATITY